jgi:hypothetical protein
MADQTMSRIREAPLRRQVATVDLDARGTETVGFPFDPFVRAPLYARDDPLPGNEVPRLSMMKVRSCPK